MRKEIVFAVLGGVLVGVIVAFGAWRANMAIGERKSSENQQSETTEASDDSNVSTELELVISKPINYQVLTESTFNLVGASKPSSLLAVFSERDIYIDQLSDLGNIDEQIDLLGGINEIIIKAFDQDGEIEKRLVLAYSSQFDERESGSDNINNRLEEARNIATSLYGTITDIAGEGIQISEFGFNDSDESDILLLNTTDSTEYVKITDKSSESIELDEIAIGDFVVAMGYLNDESVLESRRILVIQPIKPTTRDIVRGSLGLIDTGEFVLSSLSEDYLFVVDRYTDYTYFDSNGETAEVAYSDLEEGYQALVFYDIEDDGDLYAWRVHLTDYSE